MERTLDDVQVGDVVRGWCQTERRMVTIVVKRKAYTPFDGYFVGVAGFEVNNDGTIRNRIWHQIGKGLPGNAGGTGVGLPDTYVTDYSTGEKSWGGWDYKPEITPRRADDDKRGKWAEPIKQLGVGATVDFDCEPRSIQTIRVCASRIGIDWNRKYSVERTLSGCAVTRKL